MGSLAFLIIDGLGYQLSVLTAEISSEMAGLLGHLSCLDADSVDSRERKQLHAVAYDHDHGILSILDPLTTDCAINDIGSDGIGIISDGHAEILKNSFMVG